MLPLEDVPAAASDLPPAEESSLLTEVAPAWRM